MFKRYIAWQLALTNLNCGDIISRLAHDHFIFGLLKHLMVYWFRWEWAIDKYKWCPADIGRFK